MECRNGAKGGGGRNLAFSGTVGRKRRLCCKGTFPKMVLPLLQAVSSWQHSTMSLSRGGKKKKKKKKKGKSKNRVGHNERKNDAPRTRAIAWNFAAYPNMTGVSNWFFQPPL